MYIYIYIVKNDTHYGTDSGNVLLDIATPLGERSCEESGKIMQMITGCWFQPTPLKNMTSSVGMMTFPIYIYIYIHMECHKIPWFQSPPTSDY